MSASRPDLAAWIARIRERDMPIFGDTVARISSAARNEKSSAAALAQVILQDAAMTAKLLKLANSAFFNPSRQAISTISRAIVVLGFDLVQHMALSLALIDSLLQGGLKERMVQEMARSFHAAVQARAAAVRRRDGSPEEVFIAALLSHVGELAFWCFGEAAAKALDEALRQPDAGPEQAETSVLGFRLRQLTAGLVRDWHLSPLLSRVAEGAPRPGSRESGVVLSYELALGLEAGWESPEARRGLQAYAQFVGESLEALLPEVASNTAEAARIAGCYGALEAARQIPLPPAAPALRELLEPAVPSKPDPVLQLQILRDLSFLIARRPNLNDLLEMVLEGLYRGVGMDRALFALVSPDRRHLVAKGALGADSERLHAGFAFALTGVERDLLVDAVERQESFFVTGTEPARELAPSARLRRLTGATSFIVAPIITSGRAIGLFYGDRARSGSALGDEDLQSFLLFVQQANLGFQYIVSQPGRK